MGLPIWSFVFAKAIVPLFQGIFSYAGNKINFSYLKEIRFDLMDLKFSREFLIRSFPVAFSSISISIFGFVDVYMLKIFNGFESVGIYSIANTFAISYYFIFTLVTQAVTPYFLKVFNDNKEIFNKAYKKFLLATQLSAIFLSLTLYLVNSRVNLFSILGGKNFSESNEVFYILVWAGVFVAFNASSWIWFNCNKNYKEVLWKNASGIGVNVILNYILIPRFSVYGAAIATLLSRAWISHLSLLFTKDGRNLLKFSVESFTKYKSLFA